ncbi:MAG: hypothetical protein QMB62_05200 [Oscillospiraceae bacterium]
MEEEKTNPNLAEPSSAEEKTDKPPKTRRYTRENLYSHIDLTVHQLDIIITVLAVLLALAVIVGIIVK